MSAQKQHKVENNLGTLSPGAHLRAEIQRLGLDQVAVSKATGVSRQSVNNIINGRQAISRAMAGKLGRLTGHGSDYWLAAFFSRKGKANKSAAARIAAIGVLVDHQIIRVVEEGVILISPFTEANVHTASIDLTLRNALTLAPGKSAVARTRERIELPRDYLGRIGILGELAGAGVFATHALQLEPGFKGEIECRLFNAGHVIVRLRTGETVLGLEIVRLGTTPNLKFTT